MVIGLSCPGVVAAPTGRCLAERAQPTGALGIRYSDTLARPNATLGDPEAVVVLAGRSRSHRGVVQPG